MGKSNTARGACLVLASWVMGCDGGSRVLDLSHPVLLAALGDAPAFGIALDGKGHAYVSTQRGLVVVEIGAGKDARVVATLDGAWVPPSPTLLAGTTVFAGGLGGVAAIDVSTPTAPRGLPGVDAQGLVRGLAVVGRHLYAAGESDGLLDVDIADATVPLVGKPLATDGANGVVADEHQIVISGPSGYRRFDVAADGTTADTPVFGTRLVHDVVLVGGGYVYGRLDPSGFEAYDVRDLLHPVEVPLIAAVGADSTGMSLTANRLFLTSSVGLKIFDVSHPRAPAQLGELSTASPCFNATTDERFLYVASMTGLSIYGPGQ